MDCALSWPEEESVCVELSSRSTLELIPAPFAAEVDDGVEKDDCVASAAFCSAFKGYFGGVDTAVTIICHVGDSLLVHKASNLALGTCMHP